LASYREQVLFFGHIAASLLVADVTGSDRATTVAGNLVPDVIDKTLSWVLKLTPSGRWLAHGLPFFSLASAFALVVVDRRRARGFALGYAGHLVCDLWGGGRVPWLAPFETPQRRRRSSRWTRKALTIYLIPEVVGAPVVVYLLGRPRV
jgi:hypothetical protein